MIHVRNWEKFQHPDVVRGKQRGPRWIKVYTELMSDPAFLELTMHQRGVLISIWLTYATSRRQLSDNSSTLARQLGHRVLKRDLEALNHAGFIELPASNLQAEIPQVASPEESREEKTSLDVTPAGSGLDFHGYMDELAQRRKTG